MKWSIGHRFPSVIRESCQLLFTSNPTYYCCFQYLLLIIFIVPPVVPECTAPYGIHNDEEDKEDNVDNSRLLPVTFQIVKQSSLAWLAIEAQNLCIIIPFIAVRVDSRRSSILGPDCGTYIGKTTVIRWLTAAGLQISKHVSKPSKSNKAKHKTKCKRNTGRQFLCAKQSIKFQLISQKNQ